MKSYTDLEQSKKLAEIFPNESADMWWNYYSVTTDSGTTLIFRLNTPWVGSFNWNNKPDNIPCWSLAALIGVLPEIQGGKPIIALDDNYITYPHINDLHTKADNLIDAVYKMIIRLNEQNLL